MFRHALFIVISCLTSFVQLDAFCVDVTFSTTGIHRQRKYSTVTLHNRSDRNNQVLFKLRGGSDGNFAPHLKTDSSLPSTTALSASLTALVPTSMLGTWIAKKLLAGPLGVVALTAISSAICIPITQYKNLYGISVGYGLSVACIAAVLRSVFVIPPWSIMDVTSGAALFYGLRLALFLFIRDVSGAKSLDATKKSGRLQRIPFAVSLALFYAFIVTPLLYVMRNPPIVSASNVSWKLYLAWTGCGLAWMGAIMEAIADTHKYIVKGRSNSSADVFRGPTQGLYSITRHPNYTGEVIFWFGVFTTGLPSFGNSIIAWLCSSAGLYGIITIMRGATKSLEKRQGEKYNGQPKYENWKKDVSTTLMPFI